MPATFDVDFSSKDSLHMQRYKKEQREENLRLARSETG